MGLQDRQFWLHAVRLKAAWLSGFIAVIVLFTLGILVWSYRIPTSHGFLMDSSNLLVDSYQQGLQFFPKQYLPGVAAHRPIGRDAITLFLKLFGENDVSIVWTLLSIHLVSSALLWYLLYRLTCDWWASLAGATIFLLNISAYLVIYWPAAVFDLLSTFFLILLLTFVAIIIRPKERYRPWLLLLTLPLLLMAVKAKESTIVVIIPLFLIVLFSKPLRETNIPTSFSTFFSEPMKRFRKLSLWEAMWAIFSVLLVITLVLTIESDYRQSRDPNYPYYTKYSFEVIGRSFGYFMALLLFKSDDLAPMQPAFAHALLLTTLVVACVLRNQLMMIGWVWYVVFLLPLAALKNHYSYIYYPYPANVGLALFVGGFISSLAALEGRWKIAHHLRCALALILIALLAQHAYQWIKFDHIPKWYDDFHARSRKMLSSLKAVLPDPPENAEIVLVVPEVTQFDQGPTQVLRIAYHDLTLKGALFSEQQKAEEYLANHGTSNLFLIVWKGDRFELSTL